jgi:hypothetical protein
VGSDPSADNILAKWEKGRRDREVA